jgi:hypothetical protein
VALAKAEKELELPKTLTIAKEQWEMVQKEVHSQK